MVERVRGRARLAILGSPSDCSGGKRPARPANCPRSGWSRWVRKQQRPPGLQSGRAGCCGGAGGLERRFVRQRPGRVLAQFAVTARPARPVGPGAAALAVGRVLGGGFAAAAVGRLLVDRDQDAVALGNRWVPRIPEWNLRELTGVSCL